MCYNDPMSEITTLSAGGPAFELAFSVSFRDPQTKASTTNRAILLSRAGLLYQSASLPAQDSPFPPPGENESFPKWGNAAARKLLKEARYNPLQCQDIYDNSMIEVHNQKVAPQSSRIAPSPVNAGVGLISAMSHSAGNIPPQRVSEPKFSRSRSIQKADLRDFDLPVARPSYSPQFNRGCAYAERPESGTLVAMIDTCGDSQFSNKSVWAKNAEEAWEDFVNHICRPSDHWQNLVHLPPLGDAHTTFSSATLVDIVTLIQESNYIPLYLNGVLDAVVRSDQLAAVRVSRRESDGKETASFLLKTSPSFEASGFDWRGSRGANATALIIEHGDDAGNILPFIRVEIDRDDTLYIRRTSKWAMVNDHLVYLTRRKVALLRIPLPPNTYVPLHEDDEV